MTLTDLAAFGSFVSGIAVVITLVFLLLQMRQTNRNQRALMNQGVITRSADITMWLSEPHVASVWSRILSGEVNLTREEQSQAYSILRTILLNLQDSYIQHKSGQTDDITFQNSTSAIKIALQLQVLAIFWKNSRHSYAPEFADFVDGIIQANPTTLRSKVFDQIEADLAGMKAAAP